MTGVPGLDQLRALYGPTVGERLEHLQEASRGIAHAALELKHAPTSERAETLATWLGGAQRTAAAIAHDLAARERESKTTPAVDKA